ncbi:MAG TPA: hypothetical protein VIG80_15165 [Bacillaceae bacterium]
MSGLELRAATPRKCFAFPSCDACSRKLTQCPAGTARAEDPGLSEAREAAEAVPAESVRPERDSIGHSLFM